MAGKAGKVLTTSASWVPDRMQDWVCRTKQKARGG